MHFDSRRGDIGLGMAGLALATFIAVQIGDIPTRSFGDPLGARLMPMIVAGCLAALSLALIVIAFRKAPAQDETSDDEARGLGTFVLLLAAASLYAFAMPYLGFYTVTAMLAMAVLTLGRPERSVIIRNLVMTAFITAAFYLVFGLGLRVPFPTASLFQGV